MANLPNGFPPPVGRTTRTPTSDDDDRFTDTGDNGADSTQNDEGTTGTTSRPIHRPQKKSSYGPKVRSFSSSLDGQPAYYFPQADGQSVYMKDLVHQIGQGAKNWSDAHKRLYRMGDIYDDTGDQRQQYVTQSSNAFDPTADLRRSSTSRRHDRKALIIASPHAPFKNNATNLKNAIVKRWGYDKSNVLRAVDNRWSKKHIKDYIQKHAKDGMDIVFTGHNPYGGITLPSGEHVTKAELKEWLQGAKDTNVIFDVCRGEEYVQKQGKKMAERQIAANTPTQTSNDPEWTHPDLGIG